MESNNSAELFSAPVPQNRRDCCSFHTDAHTTTDGRLIDFLFIYLQANVRAVIKSRKAEPTRHVLLHRFAIFKS
jgi:hypothetical protein